MEARGSERKRDREPASWTARILAPVVLALAAAAIVLVINGSVGGADEADDGGAGRESATTTSDGCQPDADQAVEDGYFVIEPGEDLSIVADRTCLPVDELIELNPNLDPQLIQPGNCVDLRIDGCKALAEQ